MARVLKLTAQGLALAGVAGLLVLLVWKVTHHPGAKLNAAIAHGKKPAAPNFDLPRLDGSGKVSLASLRGKAVVINFWNAYCVPCKAEAPLLERAWQRWRAQGVVVVGVDFEDFTGDARHFARLGIRTYGFLPLNNPADFNGATTIHAADERVPVSALEFGARCVFEAVMRYRG